MPKRIIPTKVRFSSRIRFRKFESGVDSILPIGIWTKLRKYRARLTRLIGLNLSFKTYYDLYLRLIAKGYVSNQRLLFW